METIRNFRELGGLPTVDGRRVRSGLLFRSGHLADASDDDLAVLADHRIRTVLDLRNDHDVATEGVDRLPPGSTGSRIPTGADTGIGPAIRKIAVDGDLDRAEELFGDGKAFEMARLGAEQMAVDEHLVAHFGRIVRVVTDPVRWPVLWHCSAGKDRAGWVATAVLLALDVEREVIVDHYVASNAGRPAMPNRGPARLHELLEPFVLVHPDYVRAQLDAVDRVWGGAEGLLIDGFGWSPTRVENVRRLATD